MSVYEKEMRFKVLATLISREVKGAPPKEELEANKRLLIEYSKKNIQILKKAAEMLNIKADTLRIFIRNYIVDPRE